MYGAMKIRLKRRIVQKSSNYEDSLIVFNSSKFLKNVERDTFTSDVASAELVFLFPSLPYLSRRKKSYRR
jgi:hypothetical protein